jgi:hypothetical protein
MRASLNSGCGLAADPGFAGTCADVGATVAGCAHPNAEAHTKTKNSFRVTRFSGVTEGGNTYALDPWNQKMNDEQG